MRGWRLVYNSLYRVARIYHDSVVVLESLFWNQRVDGFGLEVGEEGLTISRPKAKFPVTNWEFMNSLFRVSERNHLGLIFMTQLAALAEGSFLSVKDAAEQMGMPQGYLEEIAGALKASGLVAGRQGPGGGYKLAKPSKEISAKQIVEALEGPVSLVSCQGGHCPVESKCQSKKLWTFLQKDVLNTLETTKLGDLSTTLEMTNMHEMTK